MTQQQVVRGTATSLFNDTDGKTKVVYHKTAVVAFDGEHITLDSGGWRTATTKTRMNQASNQMRLGYQVFQKDSEWFVLTREGKTLDFEDGMTFPLRRGPVNQST